MDEEYVRSKKSVFYIPHVDKILREGDTFGISSDGDRTIKICGSISILAVGNTYHGSGKLSKNTIFIFLKINNFFHNT